MEELRPSKPPGSDTVWEKGLALDAISLSPCQLR